MRDRDRGTHHIARQPEHRCIAREQDRRIHHAPPKGDHSECNYGQFDADRDDSARQAIGVQKADEIANRHMATGLVQPNAAEKDDAYHQGLGDFDYPGGVAIEKVARAEGIAIQPEQQGNRQPCAVDFKDRELLIDS